MWLFCCCCSCFHSYSALKENKNYCNKYNFEKDLNCQLYEICISNSRVHKSASVGVGWSMTISHHTNNFLGFDWPNITTYKLNKKPPAIKMFAILWQLYCKHLYYIYMQNVIEKIL